MITYCYILTHFILVRILRSIEKIKALVTSAFAGKKENRF